jgi:hypothetical protein
MVHYVASEVNAFRNTILNNMKCLWSFIKYKIENPDPRQSCKSMKYDPVISEAYTCIQHLLCINREALGSNPTRDKKSPNSAALASVSMFLPYVLRICWTDLWVELGGYQQRNSIQQ